METDHDPRERGRYHAGLTRPGQEYEFFARPRASPVGEKAGKTVTGRASKINERRRQRRAEFA